jgi:TRAP transporter TAXI family solute receptor
MDPTLIDTFKEVRMRRFTVLGLGLALALAIVLPGEAQNRNLTWTAGQVGGGWYTQAGGFVELIKSKDPSFNIKVVPGAGIQNMTKLQQAETEIAWGLPPFIVAAYQGQDPYKDKHPDMRLVMNGLGFVHSQWAVPADYPYKSIREIFESKKAITIGTTPPGGSDEWVMRKIFEFYKTTYNDVRSRGGKVILVSYTDLANQYRDRNMDIFFSNLAVPGASLQEASLGRKMKILPMDEDLLKFLEGFGLVRGVVPKGSYKDVVNNDQDIPTVVMANTIVANAKVPADVVHDFTRVLVSNVDAVRKVHPAFKDFDPKDAVRLANVPLHPGAERAYREAGLLK